jgi:Zn-finger nucleic acid-binding protein
MQCNGIFFDKGELDSLIEMVQLFLGLELEEEDIETTAAEKAERLINCPADGDLMESIDFGVVVVDICNTCGGVWLDGGEIAALKLAENNIRHNHDLYVRLAQ